MRQPSADRAHRHPRDGACRAPRAPAPLIGPVHVDVIGTGRTVTTGAGLTLPVTTHPRERSAAAVVVAPAPGTMTAADALSALAARATRAIIRARRHITDEDYHQR